MNNKTMIKSITEENAWPEEDVRKLVDLTTKIILFALANGKQVQWGGFLHIHLKKGRPAHASGRCLYEDTKEQQIRYWKPCCSFDGNVVHLFQNAQFNDADRKERKKSLDQLLERCSRKQKARKQTSSPRIPEDMRACINKTDIVQGLSAQSGWTTEKAGEMLDQLEITIKRALANGEQMSWNGLMRAWVKKTRPRNSTGKYMYSDTAYRKMRCWEVGCSFKGKLAYILKDAEFNDADPESRRKASEKILDEWKKANENAEELTHEQERYIQAGC